MAAKSGCALLALVSVAGCSTSPRGEIYNRPLAANPSAFVAADIGFARLAQEKGQIAAFREQAHPDAVLLNPQVKPVRDALRGQAEPAERMRWQPHAVVTSCDGNVGVTEGAWQQGAQQGRYVRLWQRDDKGRIQWRVDQREVMAQAPEAPEFIRTRQATCLARAAAEDVAETSFATMQGGARDNSLRWTIHSKADGSGELAVRIWDGNAVVPVALSAREQAAP